MTIRHHRRRLISIATILAAGALALTSCGNAGAPRAASSMAVGGGPTTLTSVDGHRISVPVPGEPTAVFFFSVSCGECVEGVRSLGKAAAAADEQGDHANFFAVDLDPGESKKIIEDFMDYVNAELVPAAIDTGARLSRRFKVAALSTLIVIDADGKVTFRGTSPSAKTITAELAKAGA